MSECVSQPFEVACCLVKVESATPPGKPAHVFTDLPRNQLETYTLPDAGSGTAVERRQNGFNEDRHYECDDRGRMIEVWRAGALESSYTFDANPNRLSFTGPLGNAAGTYDERDRILTYGGATYTWSEAGELQSKTEGTYTTTYDYDVFGNLRKVELPNGIEIEYLTDGAQRRIGKKIDGVLVKQWLYDDLQELAAELDGTGNLISRFVFGNRFNSPEIVIKSDGAYRLISDRLGSPRLIVNTDNGAMAQQIRYDEFGRNVLNTNSDFQEIGFAGGLGDQQVDIYRFGLRDYMPRVGSWLASDPTLFTQGPTNVYSYLSGNPVTEIDPTGTAGCFVDFPDFPITVPGTEYQTTLTPGHAGFLGYDEKSGATRYYEYGRYDSDFGNARRVKMPNLEIGKDGQPTKRSLDNLTDALSKRAGKGTPAELSCDTDVDEKKGYEYAEKIMRDPNRKPYSWNPFAMNTCRTFASRAMEAGRE